MICSMTVPGAWLVSKKTAGNLPAARRRRSIGVVTITAPRVPPRTMMAAVSCATSFTLPCSSTRPPRTMMAAVSCATSFTLPCSSTRPPRMPASARAKPPNVARSGRCPDGFFASFAESGAGAVVSAMSYSISTAIYSLASLAGRRALPGRDGRTEQNAAVDGSTELHHPPDYLFGGFQHHQFLPSGQTDHRVGGHLDRLNEVRIEHQRPMVEAREVDHETSILIGRAGRSRRGFQQKAELPAGL